MTGLAPGTEFAGHRIDAVAGRGGMGVVYRATQKALDRVVALKLIVPELADDPGLRDRFERESRIAASIDHPNVLPLYYAGEQDGVLYQAMRYVDGTDLRTLVRAHGALPADRAVAIVSQVAAALDAAHARGLVHRDVKPANVMLTEGDHAYLGDFGLSRRTASQDASSTGSVVGTFDYVAPEQIRGERVDARADVYALGGVLFTALTGQVPFPRENDEARLWAHLHATPPRASERAPHLPADLDPVLERALAKRPEDRYPSAGDLGRAARAALEGNPISQPERRVAAGEAAPLEGPTVSAAIQPFPRRYRAGSRRRRFALLLGGLAATAAAAFAAASLIGSGEEAGAPAPEQAARGGADRSGGATPRPTPLPALRVTRTAEVGYRPSGVTVAGGYVWVSGYNDGVMRMRWPGMDHRATVRRARGTGAIARGFGSVWISWGPARSLERVDPRTARSVVATLALPHRSRSLAVGAGAVWSAGLVPASIARISPDGRAVTGRVPLAVRSLAARGHRLWAVGDNRRLYEIDARTLQVLRKVVTGANPDGVAVGGGAVWVANGGDDSVLRYDLHTHRRAFIGVPDGPTKIAIQGNSVWVTSRESDQLARIDARTRRLFRETLPMSGDPFAVAADPRFVWVTQLGNDRVSRVSY